ncbi:hypothetical protein [Luedemannella helvata]|uniref:SRPBCC domain-containing protein n=1 Tax=Luedemannella helvata TaxID=349315 RepID=A0ABN2KVP9_9ACTN
MTLTYRPGSKQDPTFRHPDGTHNVLVSDIIQKGTPPQVYRGLTNPAALRDWTGDDAAETADGVGWKLPELGVSGTSIGEVEGEYVKVVLDTPAWPTTRSVATVRLWPVPRATLVMVSHRGLTADDLELSRALWAPGLLNRLRFWVQAMAPHSRAVGIVDTGGRE